GAGTFASLTDVTTLNGDGTTTETVTDFNANGSVKDRHVATQSANGLSTTTQWDTNGSGSFNQTATAVTTVNAAASRTETVTALAGGALMSRPVVTPSADGRTVTRQFDTTGSGRFNESETAVTNRNADGSSSKVVTDFDGFGVETDQAVTTVSADSLTVSI